VKPTKEELAEAFRLDEFPRSAKYDAGWVIENLMGPNVLWLAESLIQVMDLEPGMRVLDMGCGSGVLAIGAAKRLNPRMLRRRVLAVDNDPRSVAVTAENIHINHVRDRVIPLISEGFRRPEVTAYGPYNLILANILARPLARMAPVVVRHLAPGGRLVLSGLTPRQDAWVRNAYRRRGLVLEARLVLDGWTTLLMRRAWPQRPDRPRHSYPWRSRAIA